MRVVTLGSLGSEPIKNFNIPDSDGQMNFTLEQAAAYAETGGTPTQATGGAPRMTASPLPSASGPGLPLPARTMSSAETWGFRLGIGGGVVLMTMAGAVALGKALR